ncbi:hypothetical protein BpHYR1_038594 [Brachionus plicatilis]|uniref:Uncharacterized protein n=1 Tax=Brachionus plicatilis TaxID=10195 RepID=A0A3M7PPY1_BRAPC|nr:hypothetical protein BpHYR1_038594 [Brachionus plicatilis]
MSQIIKSDEANDGNDTEDDFDSPTPIIRRDESLPYNPFKTYEVLYDFSRFKNFLYDFHRNKSLFYDFIGWTKKIFFIELNELHSLLKFEINFKRSKYKLRRLLFFSHQTTNFLLNLVNSFFKNVHICEALSHPEFSNFLFPAGLSKPSLFSLVNIKFTKFKTLVLSEFHIFDSKFVIYAIKNPKKNFFEGGKKKIFYTQGSKKSKPFKNIYILKEYKILYKLIQNSEQIYGFNFLFNCFISLKKSLEIILN